MNASALTQDELDLRFHALSQARRRSILRLVGDREVAAGEIAAAFDVTRTAVSQHLTILKEAGLVTERREGTRRLYRARRESLPQLHDALDAIWAGALDRGKALAEGETQ
ncbi:ArsR/SmtB family transcription factor [Lysobacter korlensis]|uniref:ArsR/SmtB family transcription factor n=1 Tax=Lysobacter korlensis TaxID=553636 RepID=A0ABV6RSW3_9GAMM